MKNVFYYVMMCLCLTLGAASLASCSDDDENVKIDNALLGKWYLTMVDGSPWENSTNEHLEITKTKLYWNNQLNGNSETFTYTVKNNSLLTMKNVKDNGTRTFVYLIEGNRLYLEPYLWNGNHRVFVKSGK